MVRNCIRIILLILCIETFIYAGNFKHRGFEKILTSIYKGDTKNVEDRINKILQITTKEWARNTLLFLRAYSSYIRYLYKDAEDTCKEVLSENRNHRECLWLLFRVYINKGEIDKAEALLNPYRNNFLSLDREIQNLLEILNATLLFEAFKFDKFTPSAKKIFKKFIEEKKYKNLNIFEIEELANILFSLYQRTGKIQYLNYVIYFEGEGLPEEKARDLIEYMLLKNKFNINAYILCASIGYEYRQANTFRECMQNIRRINKDHPIVSFFDILLNLRQLLIQNPGQLLGALNRLAQNAPDFYPTYLLLALVYSNLGNTAQAEENAFKVLRFHKGDLQALGILYNIFKSRGNEQKVREILNEIIANKYKYAQFLLELGEQTEAVARFVHAHKYYKRAYKLDKNNIRVLKGYATNLSRMKREITAYKLLKKYIKMNPFDKGTMNVFNLLEKIRNEFSTIKTKNFVIKLHRTVEQSRVSDVFDDTLMPFYLGEVAEKALEVLTERYGINLPVPIHLELLTDSEDLAVRTFGFPILGVLGSCFGPFLTTLSQKARFDLPTPFNWAAVFWHELSHSFHLYLSEFKVPRWFTEGLATYEESLGDPRWFDVNILLVYITYTSGQLPKLKDLILNRAQIGNQRLIFYDYGAMIQEYIHKTYGFSKTIELLKLWGKDLSSEEVFKRALGKSVDEISEEFDKYMKNKFKDIKLFVSQFTQEEQAMLQILLQDIEKLPKKQLRREEINALAKYAVFLLNSDKKGAHRLSKIILEKDENNGIARYVSGFVQRNLFLDNKKAKEEFERAVTDGFDYTQVYRDLGTLYLEESDYAKAEEYLKKAIEKNPYYLNDDEETNPYLLLGKIYEETNQYEKAQEVYDKYLSIYGKNYKLLTKIGDKFFSKGDLQKALDYYKLAIYVKADNPLVHFNVARVYLKLKEYDKALQILEIVQKFALAELENTKKKKEKDNKREMLAKIFCVKSKIHKALGNLTSAEKYAKQADKFSTSIKCIESLKK